MANDVTKRDIDAVTIWFLLVGSSSYLVVFLINWNRQLHEMTTPDGLGINCTYAGGDPGEYIPGSWSCQSSMLCDVGMNMTQQTAAFSKFNISELMYACQLLACGRFSGCVQINNTDLYADCIKQNENIGNFIGVAVATACYMAGIVVYSALLQNSFKNVIGKVCNEISAFLHRKDGRTTTIDSSDESTIINVNP